MGYFFFKCDSLLRSVLAGAGVGVKYYEDNMNLSDSSGQIQEKVTRGRLSVFQGWGTDHARTWGTPWCLGNSSLTDEADLISFSVSSRFSPATRCPNKTPSGTHVGQGLEGVPSVPSPFGCLCSLHKPLISTMARFPPLVFFSCFKKRGSFPGNKPEDHRPLFC